MAGHKRAHYVRVGASQKVGQPVLTSVKDQDSSDALITADGVKLHCRYSSTHTPRATVVLAHGFAGSCDHVCGRPSSPGPPELAGVVSISAQSTWRTPRSAPGALVIGLARTRLGRQIAKHHLHVRIAPTWNLPPFPAELVRDIVIPIAIVHGDQDRYIPPSDAQAISQACRSPYRRLDPVPGMGHAFDQKALTAVNDAWTGSSPKTCSDRQRQLNGANMFDESEGYIDAPFSTVLPGTGLLERVEAWLAASLESGSESRSAVQPQIPATVSASPLPNR
jgi:hypothetical protein